MKLAPKTQFDSHQAQQSQDQIVRQFSLIKGNRTTTGSIAAGAFTNVTITWDSAWPDTNYTVVSTVLDPVGSLEVFDVISLSTTQVVVEIHNSSGGALTGTIHTIGVHD